MKKVFFKDIYKSIGLSLLLVCGQWGMAQENNTTSYSESYSASYKGFSGRAELSIEENNTNYQVVLAIYPQSLLAKMAISSLVDSSQGNIRQGRYYPQRYRRVKNGDKQMLAVSFADNKATVIDKRGSKAITLSALGQDPLSQIVQIQHDLRLGTLQPAYYLVTNRSERRYNVVSATGKSDKGAMQKYQVTLVEHPSKNRTLHLWFDEALRLTKMQKFKHGELDLQIEKQEKQ